VVVRAQQPGRLFRIGYLTAGAPPLPVEERAIPAFIKALDERGLVQGRDFVIEYRYGDNRPDRLAEVAAELSASGSMFSLLLARSRPWL
jgi:putative tryptophan/tyrosine transport system substrate-binding protein